MKLKSLRIEMNRSYQENPGQYSGEIEYEGKSGKFTLILDTMLSARVLAAVGQTAEETSRIALASLHENISQSIAEAQGKSLELNPPSA